MDKSVKKTDGFIMQLSAMELHNLISLLAEICCRKKNEAINDPWWIDGVRTYMKVLFLAAKCYAYKNNEIFTFEHLIKMSGWGREWTDHSHSKTKLHEFVEGLDDEKGGVVDEKTRRCLELFENGSRETADKIMMETYHLLYSLQLSGSPEFALLTNILMGEVNQSREKTKDFVAFVDEETLTKSEIDELLEGEEFDIEDERI